MKLTSDQFADLVVEANLAPSVHNTQPTRWRLEPDGAVLVLEDQSRRLPVGDPEGRDTGVSHGAAIEGFALACTTRGLCVSEVNLLTDNSTNGVRPVARLTLEDASAADLLQSAVARRWTYRGAFAKADLGGAFSTLETRLDVTLVKNKDAIAHLADMNDAASLRTFRDAAYRAELLSWMRLSSSDPRWAVDGLNADAMHMSSFDALGASLVLRPGIFETLDRVGIAAPIVAEAKVVRSASGIALFHRPVGESPIQTGRHFYRFWLKVAAQGLSAAPMAVLADDPITRSEIAEAFNLPANRRLITTFRLGKSHRSDPMGRPRLPLNALLA